jgi:hypothetical protein
MSDITKETSAVQELVGGFADFLEQGRRERLGRTVRDVWIAFAKRQKAETGIAAKPSHLVSWDELDEPNKQVDREVGDACFQIGFQEGVQAAAIMLAISHPEAFNDLMSKLYKKAEPPC